MARALGYFLLDANVVCAWLEERLAASKLDLINAIRKVIENEIERAFFVAEMDSAYPFDADKFEAVVKEVALDPIAI